MTDRAFHQSRLAHYDFLTALLMEIPSRETLALIFERDRVAGEAYPHASLKEGWEIIDAFLDERGSDSAVQEEVAQEFTNLFISLGGGQVLPFESKYIDGKLMDRSLARLRRFLKEVGLAKAPKLIEPEDSLAVELDIMRHLIENGLKETNGHDDRWLEYQEAFLNNHLLCWGLDFFKDLEKAPSAKFYRGVAKVGYGFLFLERETYGHLGLETKKTRGEEIYEKRKKKF
jgi:TorA maturation chaperone TorD